MPTPARSLLVQRGFTLVELVIVIVILGVIGGMVAVFMRSPIEAYFATGRRAELTDVADTAVRRISRDLRKALPNSVAVTTATGGQACLVFIPTRNGARYREQNRAVGDGLGLDFAAADNRFNMLGRNADWSTDQQIQANDVVAIYNLGIPGATAYSGSNVARVSAVVADAATTPEETTITLASATLFPLESGSRRFHIIPAQENVVAYVCNGSNLLRTVTPSNVASATSVFTGATASSYCGLGGSVLANNVQVSGGTPQCSFVYNGSDSSRNGLVQINLSLTSSNETVTLYHQVQVNNAP